MFTKSETSGVPINKLDYELLKKGALLEAKATPLLLSIRDATSLEDLENFLTVMVASLMNAYETAGGDVQGLLDSWAEANKSVPRQGVDANE